MSEIVVLSGGLIVTVPSVERAYWKAISRFHDIVRGFASSYSYQKVLGREL